MPELHKDSGTARDSGIQSPMGNAGCYPGCGCLFDFKQGTIADYNTRSLSPITKTQSNVDRQIRSELGHWSGGNLLLVTGKTDQQVLTRLESLEPFMDLLVENNVISDFTSVASMLPSAELQQQRQLLLPAKAELEKNLAAVISDFPFKPGLFQEFIDDVEASKTLEPITLAVLGDYQLKDKVAGLLHQKDDLWYAPVLLYRVSDQDRLRKQLADLIADEDWTNDQNSGEHWIHYINLQNRPTKSWKMP